MIRIISFIDSTALKNLFTSLATALIFFNIAPAGAQDSSIIEKKFNDFQKNNLQEKIFVHTDKSNYTAGEICWFKIYNVDAWLHKPLNLSKIAYVEILDKNNKAVLQAKIALNKGLGDGSFFLPVTIASGNYRFRAYTNWMKNFGPGYFFQKRISISNAQKLPVDKEVSKANYEIAFFPEGGNLINGIQSKVGFRVADQYGRGVDCEGVVLTEKGVTVTSFRSLKFGLGNFTFTPLSGNKYKVSVKIAGGTQQLKELPAAYDSGYSMHVESSVNDKIKITVQTPDKNLSAPVYLFVHTRNVLKAVLSGNLHNGKTDFSLDYEKPGDGISQFTIFNEYRQPVCERLFFKRPVSMLQVTADADKPSYGLRSKINIGVSTATADNKAIASNLSIAVYRIESITDTDEQDINSYLMLSSDIQGMIESPAYYFGKHSDRVAADNLMLTQGWRRFKWEDVLSARKPAFDFLPEINGHIINGKLTALRPGLQLDNINTYLGVPGTRVQFQAATGNENGSVKFEMKNFYCDGDIIAQTDNTTDSGYRLDIEQPFFAGYQNAQLPPFDLNRQNAALLKNYVSTQVQNTFSYSQLNRSLLPSFDTTAFYFKPDAVYLLDNYVRFTTLEEVLREYVFEVNVRKHGGRFSLPVFDVVSKAPFKNDPLVLLDGVPVFDFNKLMKYDPLKIRKLEVMSRKYFLGNSSFDGIVSFTTYKGDLDGYEIDPHATIIDYEGLQLKRDFYAPVFETQEQLHSRLPDFRSLLYWSPQLITNDKGKAQVNFYSSDIAGRYAIVLQGITGDGHAGATVSYFDIKKQ